MMDLNTRPDNIVVPEFLGIVLAGFGNKLLPLTREHGGEPCPKALLPVANRPVLDYVLSWLEESGVRDVLLICPSLHRPLVSHHVHSALFSSLRIDVQSYDEPHDSGIGTCMILRQFSSRIPHDFVLLPCDFVPPPSLPLSVLLNKFRIESGSNEAIATACWYARSRIEKDSSITDDWGCLIPPEIILWDKATGTLLHVETPDDLDRNGDDVALKMALFNKYPRAILSTNYLDSHVYVCRRSVLEALHQKPHFHSFREEFIPWLCKIHYQRAKVAKYRKVLNPTTNVSSQAKALNHATLSTCDYTAFPHFGDLYERPTKDEIPPPYDVDFSTNLRVGVVIHPTNAGFASRTNTLQSYFEVNRHFLTNLSYSPPQDPQKRSLIDQTAQISAHSIVGDSTQIEERVTIKDSIVGRHCTIGKMAKIVKCVILDHCVIEEGTKLDGCILGKNTKVGAKAELLRCVTQSSYEVSAGEVYRNEMLDLTDWIASLEGENSSKSGEDSDES